MDESNGTNYKFVSTVYPLANSTVTVAETPSGPLARVERDNDVRFSVEYAVVDPETVAALEEVAGR